MTTIHDSIRAISWKADSLCLLDQRILPQRHQHIELHSAAEVADAIRDMVVRGAPAIGITAAYGVALAGRQRYAEDSGQWKQLIQQDIQTLADSRPTAVNLFWALQQMQALIDQLDGNPFEPLLAAAEQMHQQDIQDNYTMGKRGAELIQPDAGALTSISVWCS